MDEKTVLERPRDDFFTNQFVCEAVRTAQTRSNLDLGWVFGGTVRDKFEAIWVRVNELAVKAMKKGASGYFWIVGSPDVITVFECGTATYAPSMVDSTGQIPMGMGTVQYRGTVGSKFRLYMSEEMEDGMVLIGAGFSKRPACQYAVLKTTNHFI